MAHKKRLFVGQKYALRLWTNQPPLISGEKLGGSRPPPPGIHYGA